MSAHVGVALTGVRTSRWLVCGFAAGGGGGCEHAANTNAARTMRTPHDVTALADVLELLRVLHGGYQEIQRQRREGNRTP